MKSIAILLLALALLHTSLAIDCPSGFYDPGSGATRCLQCSLGIETCAATTGAVTTYHKRITGFSTASGSPVAYCAGITQYNKDKNVCQVPCK